MTEFSALVPLILAVTSAVVARSVPFISTGVPAVSGSFADDVTPSTANYNLSQIVTSAVLEHETSAPAVATSPEESSPSPSTIDHILEVVNGPPDNQHIIKTPLTKYLLPPPPEESTGETSSTHPDPQYIPLSSLKLIGLLLNSSKLSNSLDPAGISHRELGVGLTNGSLPLAFLDAEATVTVGDGRDPDNADQDNPYVHWDSDSEEQEIELHLKTNSRQESNTEAVKTEPSSPTSASVSRSYLILLAGNSTIVKLRQEDFAKYLKLNLAARLSLEYDDVKVNRVVLAPPRLVVNVSVVTPEASAEATLLQPLEESKSANDDASLHMLAETNATLLELSGEEYHVMRLLPLRSEEVDLASPIPPSMTPSDEHADIELVIYTVLGGICVAIIFATLLRIAVQRYNNITNVSWFMPKSFYPTWNLPRHERMSGEDVPVSTRHDNYPSPPTVIYSGSFAARAASSQPGWMDEALLEDTGMSALKRPFDMDISRTYQSPSKLHIFSCRPGSVVMPIPYHTPTKSHHHTEGAPAAEEDRCLGHDNPNYQT